MKKEVFGTFLMGKAIEARALLEDCNEETEPERYNYLFGRYQAMDEALNVLKALPDADEEIQNPPTEEPNPQYRWN